MQIQINDGPWYDMLRGQPQYPVKQVTIDVTDVNGLMAKVCGMFREAVEARLFEFELKPDLLAPGDFSKYVHCLFYSRLQFVNGEGRKLIDRREDVAVPDLIFACLERVGQVVDEKTSVRYVTSLTSRLNLADVDVEAERQWIFKFSNQIKASFNRVALPYQLGLPTERAGDLAFYHSAVVERKVTVDDQEVTRDHECWSDGQSSGFAAFLAAICNLKGSVYPEDLTILHGNMPFFENLARRFINDRSRGKDANTK